MDMRNNKKLILRKLLKKDKIRARTVQITKKLEIAQEESVIRL